MSNYENAAIPFIQEGNRQILTDQQLAELPWVAEFVEQFKHCFEYDESRRIWIYTPRNLEG